MHLFFKRVFALLPLQTAHYAWTRGGGLTIGISALLAFSPVGYPWFPQLSIALNQPVALGTLLMPEFGRTPNFTYAHAPPVNLLDIALVNRSSGQEAKPAILYCSDKLPTLNLAITVRHSKLENLCLPYLSALPQRGRTATANLILAVVLNFTWVIHSGVLQSCSITTLMHLQKFLLLPPRWFEPTPSSTPSHLLQNNDAYIAILPLLRRLI